MLVLQQATFPNFRFLLPFLFFLSLNVLQYNRIHNLNLILRENRGNVRFIQDRFTISCMRFPWSTTKAVRILWTIKFQIEIPPIPSFSSLRMIRPLNVHQSRNCIVHQARCSSSWLDDGSTMSRPLDVSTRCHRSTPRQAKGQQLSCNYRFPNCCDQRDATVTLRP